MLHRKTLWFITFLLLSLFVNALIGQENTSESVEHQPAEEGDSSEAQNKQAPSEYFKNIETGDDGVSMTIIFAKVRKEVDIDALYYDLNLPPQSPMIMDDAVIQPGIKLNQFKQHYEPILHIPAIEEEEE